MKRKLSFVFYVCFGAFIMTNCMTCGTRERLINATIQSDLMIQNAISEAANFAEQQAMQNTILVAQNRIQNAQTEALNAPLLRISLDRALFLEQNEQSDALIERLNVLFSPNPNDLVDLAFQIRLAIRTQQFELARELALQGRENFQEEINQLYLTRLYYSAFEADILLFPPIAPFIMPENGDRFVDFAQSSSVLFRVKKDDETIAIFKPMQSVRHTNYRGEVASYRLCQLINCSFVIPRNQELFVHEEDFFTLTRLDSFDQTRRFRRNHSHLIWHEDEEGTHWLYGTIKDWIPGFCRYPIEYLDIWSPMMTPRRDYEAHWQRRSLEQALEGLRLLPEGHFTGIMERSEDISAFEFAHQLSDIHVFDMLINNHDRELPDEPRYGMNLHFDHGQLISIDNGASFRSHEERNARESYRHLRRVRVFSRSLIHEIRMMNTEALFPILFPPSAYHDDDPQRFADFLERRITLLNYVDELIEDRGEDAILVFP